jgi:FlaA1/EpsC-like NDP-sugar epimerase
MTIRRPTWARFRTVDPSGRIPMVALDRPQMPSRPTGFAQVVARLRGRHLLVIDVIGIFIAAYLALAVRYDDAERMAQFAGYMPIIAVLVSARLASNLHFGLYNRGWRSASISELQRIVAAVLVGTFAAMTTVYLISLVPDVRWTEGFPRSFWLTEALLAVAIFGGIRFAIRVASDWAPTQPLPAAVSDRRPTLLYGAGRTGVLMAGSARRKPDAGVVPVGFLDDDPRLVGGHIANLRVFGGLEALDGAIAATGAQALLITMPSATGKAVRRVVEAGMARGLDVRTVPSLNDLLDGTLDAYRIRRVQVEDLLRRTIGTEHATAAHEIVRGRTVMITGAGGSIGSELARQVYMLRPRRLVLVDRAESALYLIQRELEGRRRRDQGSGDLGVHLANVASRAAMDRVTASERPDVIFHAAAYKHVPMMEDHPSDAAYVNIGGTLALLEAAIASGTERFVLISTDKAVRPTSVMGASKRIAEMLVREAAERTGRPFVSVRFGNVLGSNGSVVPIFQEQLEKGEALTITDPEMSRYFMTIPEAAWLTIDAAAIGQTGDLFVLDMGDPIRIVDLARDLVRLAGRDPDTQPLRIVGLRQGEKLHEELFYDVERVEPTSVPKVLRADAQPAPSDLLAVVHQLIDMATGAQEPALRSALLDYAIRDEPVAADDEEPDPSSPPVHPIDLADKAESATVAG